MNRVASVTMKDGSWVRTTVRPFRKPMNRQITTVAPIAGHTDQPTSVVSSMTDMPETPTTDPTERSNSPPIISSATPTARIPSGAAAFRYDAVPARLRNAGPAATAKSSQMRTAPTAAAAPGRVNSRASTPAAGRSEMLDAGPLTAGRDS